jgi:hypothetical protein
VLLLLLLLLQVTDTFQTVGAGLYAVPARITGDRLPSIAMPAKICNHTTMSYTAEFRFSDMHCGG